MLVKIVSGVLRPDRGELSLGGRACGEPFSGSLPEEGGAVVYQGLVLADAGSVSFNVFLGKEPTR